MSEPGRPGVGKKGLETGFTLVEMMIASVIMLVVLAVVLSAVVEGQRTVNTIAARTADINAAQSYVDEMTLSARGATMVSVLCLAAGAWGPCPASGSGEVTGSMLLTYHVTTGQAVNYTGAACSAWFFNGSELEYSSWSGPTISNGTALGNTTVLLSGVQSGDFSYFPSYVGLVDITLSLSGQASAAGSGAQEASNPSTLEAEVDNPYVVQSTPPVDC